MVVLFKFLRIEISSGVTMASENWSARLIGEIKDPSKILISGSGVVVIRDRFPKAKFHFLVLPEDDILDMYHLKTEHLPLLEEMHLLGMNAIETTRQQKEYFQIGFHAKPSMQRLHLHVISKDLSTVKTRKHWNCFTTRLFVPYEDVYKNLEKFGKISKPSEHTLSRLEAKALKCNKCSYCPSTMPELKTHLLTHKRRI